MIGAWNATQIESELHYPASLGFAAEIEDKLEAFALFRICPPECELLRVAVHPDERRKGLASSLLVFAFNQCAQLCCKVCFLEVRASNLAALRLYNALGFLEDGRRKRYYINPEEDALLLHRDLN